MAWTANTENAFLHQRSATTVTQASGAASFSDAITEDVGSDGFMGAIEITGAITVPSGNMNFDLQGSIDGSTWTKILAIAADVVPTATGVKQFTVDVRGLRCPYYRLALNANAATFTGTLSFKFHYALLAKGTGWAMSNNL